MPWNMNDAKRHTKKAESPVAKKQWSEVANSVLGKTGDEGRAVRAANSVVAQRPLTIGDRAKIKAKQRARTKA